MRPLLLSLLMLGSLGSVQAAAEPALLWVVVTAPAFRENIEPLCEQRKNQGFQVKVLQTTDILTAPDRQRRGRQVT